MVEVLDDAVQIAPVELGPCLRADGDGLGVPGGRDRPLGCGPAVGDADRAKRSGGARYTTASCSHAGAGGAGRDRKSFSSVTPRSCTPRALTQRTSSGSTTGSDSR